MSGGDDQLAEIAREAERAGEIAAPTELLALLSGLDDPINALQRDGQAHEFFAAFNKQFGFINAARFAKKPLQESDKSRCAALLRWLIQELRQWRAAEDPLCRTLAAV